MTPPLQFVFGVHLHQPVGNFDEVFRDHVEHAYLPFLSMMDEREMGPIALHVSGPLLDWLEAHDTPFLDLVGRLATDGSVELLLSGFYEPILAVLPRPDRVEQVEWMRERLSSRFGVTATGLWLTERVWEADLPADLAPAGVEYAFVDDRHFLMTGLEREVLHWPYRTEHDGHTITLLPIDERLRYMVPFRPPDETAAHLRGLRERGCRLAVFADDGEKFGGWPGTREWVYERGWLQQFLDMVAGLRDAGEVHLTAPHEAIKRIRPRGLVYLPSASYREMEAWALPPEQALRLHRLEQELGEDRMRGLEGALVRGTHWRHFLVKYPESNRMHKKMVRLSALCRAAGNPLDARHEIGRAQCNDAYWHGVFGGLYLPHLRGAVWSALARAESLLRAGQVLTVERLDFDDDGDDELWIHSAAFSAVINPTRGGAIEELTVFRTQTNWADTLTRRPESYHTLDGDQPNTKEIPPYDVDSRALLLDRVLAPGTDESAFPRGAFMPSASWTGAPLDSTVTIEEDRAVIGLRSGDGVPQLEKEIVLQSDGSVQVRYTWNPGDHPADARFSVELSLPRACPVTAEPEAEIWTHPITSLAKSERGLEQVNQGVSITVVWPVRVGGGRIELRPGE